MTNPIDATPARNIWALLDTWILIIPLVFMSTGGLMSKNDITEGRGFTAFNSDSSLLSNLIWYFLWSLLLLQMTAHLKKIYKLCVREKLFISIMCLTVASALWSNDPSLVLRKGIAFVLTVLFGMYISARFSGEQQLELLGGVGCITLVLSLLVILFLPQYGVSIAGGWKGIFGHKNEFGLNLVHSMSAWLYIQRRGVIQRITRGALLLASGLVLYETESRTAWITAASFLLFFLATLLVKKFDRLNGLVILTALMPGLVALIGVAFSNLSLIVYALGKDPTISGRSRIWKAVFSEITKRPLLGYGYGGFWAGTRGESFNVFSQIGFAVQHAHNGFLNYWLQLGAVGLVLFLLTLAAGLRHFTIIFSQQCPGYVKWYIAILFITIVANISEVTIFKANSLFTVMYVIACVNLKKAYLTR